ncbi:hypothetical protein [Terriglobus aquaticus]|uniref:Uncharacterized protein n=1 Tax=Terriglobus aquaticus TaxID=940139 RepID=A0ABW9KG14_9BACT|nr:hypothetical protein [Terriglobus aquaticus]
MNRRAMLTLFGKSAVAGVAWSSSLTRTPLAGVVASLTPVAQQTASSTYDTQLQDAMTRLSSRVYSEEGIPMILACEDLTASHPVAPLYSKPTNDRVAPAFQQYIEAWGRLHPDAPADDVAKLIELLSYRDFEHGGKDDNL